MKALDPKSEEILLAVAAGIVPETGAYEEAERAEFLSAIDQMLLSKPAGMRRQFQAFVKMVGFAPVLRFGKGFLALNAPRRASVLDWFFNCPIALLRKGFWGLKTLVLLGHYGRSEKAAAFGYRPERDGNAKLHAG